MGRPRTRDRHLPRRVYHRHGAYWFVHPSGRWQRLGATLPEAYAALATAIGPGPEEPLRTLRDVIARYRAEVLPGKAPHTQVDQGRYLGIIEAVHGHMAPAEVRPVFIKELFRRLSTRRTRANRVLELYKHLMQTAVQWGACDVNPAREVERHRLPKRMRYVTDAEFAAVRANAPPMIQCAMDLAVLTGLRRGDLLRLTRDNLTDAGILVQTTKTGTPLLIQWSDELREVVARAQAIEPRVRRHLIATHRGHGYTPDGFSAVFRRVLAATDKAHRFRWHDLRAKSASDDDLAAATARLGHTSSATTERHYRRAPRKVTPLR